MKWREESKKGKMDSSLDDGGMTVLVWHRGRGSVQWKENESKQTIVILTHPSSI